MRTSTEINQWLTCHITCERLADIRRSHEWMLGYSMGQSTVKSPFWVKDWRSLMLLTAMMLQLGNGEEFAQAIRALDKDTLSKYAVSIRNVSIGWCDAGRSVPEGVRFDELKAVDMSAVKVQKERSEKARAAKSN